MDDTNPNLYSCACGISEPDSWTLKRHRLGAESNYQYFFFHVPVCAHGHEMESLEAAEEFKRDQEQPIADLTRGA